MNRRNFMAVLLAAGAAPAIVRAGSLMRVNPRIVRPKYLVLNFGDVTDYFIRGDAQIAYGVWQARPAGRTRLLNNDPLSSEGWS